MANPMKNFIARRSCPAPRGGESSPIPAVLWPDRGVLASSLNGAYDQQMIKKGGERVASSIVKQPGTFARLCDRQKFGMVGVRTVSLSQFSGKPGIGIATKMRCFWHCKVQAKTFAGTLNAEPEF
jgi:hypothetical protein